jgi:hypothetical protein
MASFSSTNSLGLQPADDGFRDLVLDRKDVRHVAVEPLRPEKVAGFGLDQAGGDADTLAGEAYAALQ